MVHLSSGERAEVEKHLGLVHYFAARYSVDDWEEDDLRQEIAIALCEAAKDPAREKFRLSTLMLRGSKSAMRRLRYSRLLHGRTAPVSLDAPIGDDDLDGPCLLDNLAARGPLPDTMAEAHELLDMLPDRDRGAIAATVEGFSLEDIGAVSGVTGAAARARLQGALGRIRRRCR